MLCASDLFLYAYKSSVLGEMLKRVFELIRTPDVFPDYSGYAAPASSSRACRIVLHPSAFLSFPPRYHSM